MAFSECGSEFSESDRTPLRLKLRENGTDCKKLVVVQEPVTFEALIKVALGAFPREIGEPNLDLGKTRFFLGYEGDEIDDPAILEKDDIVFVSFNGSDFIGGTTTTASPLLRASSQPMLIKELSCITDRLAATFGAAPTTADSATTAYGTALPDGLSLGNVCGRPEGDSKVAQLEQRVTKLDLEYSALLHRYDQMKRKFASVLLEEAKVQLVQLQEECKELEAKREAEPDLAKSDAVESEIFDLKKDIQLLEQEQQVCATLLAMHSPCSCFHAHATTRYCLLTQGRTREKGTSIHRLRVQRGLTMEAFTRVTTTRSPLPRATMKTRMMMTTETLMSPSVRVTRAGYSTKPSVGSRWRNKLQRRCH